MLPLASPRTSRLRSSSLASLAIGALVASTVALGAMPASAANGTQQGPVYYGAIINSNGANCFEGVYTVPAGVTAIRIEATGQNGGTGSWGGMTGGRGGKVDATVPVTPGQKLWIAPTSTLFSQPGGTNFGGLGGRGSFVSTVDPTEACRRNSDLSVTMPPSALLVVAGGGGGGGASARGPGGYGGDAGLHNGDGDKGDAGGANNSPDGGDGGGGTQTSGGGGGAGGKGGRNGGNGEAGGYLTGGTMGIDSPGDSTGSGGGGGSGFYGGGGGGGAAGGGSGGAGGGSNYITPSVPRTAPTAAWDTGIRINGTDSSRDNPYIKLTPIRSTATTITASPVAPTEDVDVTLTATVKGLDGTPATTGTVDFLSRGANSGTLGSASVVNGVATLAVRLLRGTTYVTALYSGGDDGTVFRSSASPSHVENGFDVGYRIDVGASASSRAPQIDTYPTSTGAFAGLTYVLLTSAGGDPRPTVKWQRSTNGLDWEYIPGATTSALWYTLHVADSGIQYRAVWSNSYGTATTPPATITVVPSRFDVIPVDKSMAYRGVVPALEARIAPTPNYQWGGPVPSFSDLTGTLSCSTPATTAGHPGAYEILCSGLSHPDYILNFVPGVLTIEDPAQSISVAPTPRTAIVGDTHQIQATGGASGAPLVYTAQGWCTVSSSGLITFTHIASTQGSCQITIDQGSRGVYPAADRVSLPLITVSTVLPVVTQHPQDTSVHAGDTVTLSAAANPARPAITGVQWQSYTPQTGWISLPGLGDQLTTSFTASMQDNGVKYRAVILSPSGNVSTNAATLTVAPLPVQLTLPNLELTWGDDPLDLTVTPVVTGLPEGTDTSSWPSPPNCAVSPLAYGRYSLPGSYSEAVTCFFTAPEDLAVTMTRGDLTVTPRPLTITADDQTAIYGDIPKFTVFYDGLMDGYESLGGQLSCSAPSGFSAAGVPITCSGQTSARYDIRYIPGTLTLTPGTLTITGTGTGVYGSAASASPSYSGFVGSDGPTILTTVPTCATSTDERSAAGTHPGAATCSGAVAPGYTIAYRPGDVEITPAQLTVTPFDRTMTYGQNAPTGSMWFSGLRNDDYIVALSIRCAAPPVTGVGELPITCSGGTSSNYSYVYGTATLRIAPAPLTITATSQEATYGSASAATPLYSGFVLSEGPSVLTAPPACESGATQLTPVGQFTSGCAEAAASNYTISYATGTTTVEPAPLTITASSSTGRYGSGPSAVTASYSGFVNGEDEASALSAAPLCSALTNATTPAGLHAGAAQCDLALAPNYDLSYVSGDVWISRAALTATAASTETVYGAAVPEVRVAYSGLENGETAPFTPATCSTTTTPLTVAGSYFGANSCAGIVDGNYTVVYVDGNSEVTPAELSVTAMDVSSTYGATAPPVEAHYDGLVNGELAPAAAAVCASSTTPTSAVGEYAGATTCADARDDNYAISYIAGASTVSRTPLTVTPLDQTRVAGDIPVPYSVTFAGFVNDESAAVLSGALEYVTSATAQSAAGSYPLTARGLSSENYAISYETAMITVNPAPLAPVDPAVPVVPVTPANPATPATPATPVAPRTQGTPAPVATPVQSSTPTGTPSPQPTSDSPSSTTTDAVAESAPDTVDDPGPLAWLIGWGILLLAIIAVVIALLRRRA